MKSIFIAFAMYSKIPVPHTEWTEKNMKYAICYFPFIGIVIGILQGFLFYFCERNGINVLLRAALLTVLPVLVTGGIHIDGFLDTVDARSSYGDREKKMQILKDPHTGAFAVIGCIVYFVLMFGLMSELTVEGIRLFAVCYPLERALSGLSVVNFKSMNPSGSLAAFAKSSQKAVVSAVMICWIVVCALLLLYQNPVAGGVTIATGMFTFFYYRWMSYREFGGINGDMAGYFLQIAELLMLMAIVFLIKLI